MTTQSSTAAVVEFHSAADLLAAGGTELGVSDWVRVDAERVERYSAATGDAGRPGFVPGMLVLSLLAPVLGQLLHVPGAVMGVNYGVDEVRFPSEVPVGCRLRGRARIEEARPVGDAVQVSVGVTVDHDGGTEPACQVLMLARYSFAQPTGSRS